MKVDLTNLNGLAGDIRLRTQISGFTLLELALVLTIVTVLITTLINIQTYSASQLDESHNDVVSISDAATVVDTIQHEIRAAVSVDRAGTDVLELTTRYYVDDDDGDERILYQRSGSTLRRYEAQGLAAYGTSEIVLENVVRFNARALEISDNFTSSEYDAEVVEPVGDPDTVTTETAVEYTVRGLGKMDSDLVASYDSADECLVVTPSDASGTTITVSPEIERSGLIMEVDFEPDAAGVEYRPLIFGTEDPMDSALSVVYQTDGTVALRVAVAGTVVENEVTAESWVSGTRYALSVEMFEDYAVVYSKNLTARNPRVTLGKVDAAGLPSGRVYLQSKAVDKSATWDRLRISYPVIDIQLGIDTGRGETDLYGGATRRPTE